MKLLVFGRTGQVAREIGRLDPGAIRLGRNDVELSDPAAVANAVRDHRPDAVINAAAFTDVDGAERDAALAHRVNAAAPGAMARVCAAQGIPLVHFSTDYVFDGSGCRAWRPDSPTAPLNTYGASKLAGEAEVRAAGGAHAIIRTSWVFSAHGRNFVKTVLRLAAERPSLAIVADQRGAPTPADGLATASLAVARSLAEEPRATGTYHFTGHEVVSWAGFARAILEVAGIELPVSDIATADYPTPARRPLNSRLDCSSTEAVFGLARPDWRMALARVVSELSIQPETGASRLAMA